MSTPLIATSSQLAQAAVSRAPHFAAALADAARNGTVLVVDTHFSKDDLQSGKSLFHRSTVARWAAAVAAAGTMVLTAGPAPANPATENDAARSAQYNAMFVRANPEIKHVLKPVRERYQQMIGMPVNAHRLRTADQVVEDLAPADAGKTSPEMRHVSDLSSDRSRHEVILAAGAILGIGFENLVNSERSDGAFEAGLVKQLVAAMKVVAPNKMLSEMTIAEKQAVLTATMYSSNSSFMKIMSSQSPEFARAMATPQGERIKSVSASIPSAEQFLKTYSKDGKFSLEKFREEMNKLIASAPTATGTSPVALKSKLLATIALKAEPVLQSINTTMKEMGVPEANQNNPVAKFMSKVSMRVMQKVADVENRQAKNNQDGERDTMDSRMSGMGDQMMHPFKTPRPYS